MSTVQVTEQKFDATINEEVVLLDMDELRREAQTAEAAEPRAAKAGGA
jgi:hypothetical protein